MKDRAPSSPIDIEKLFEAINGGMSSDEAYSLIKQPSVDIAPPEPRIQDRNEAIQHASQILSGLPFVKGVKTLSEPKKKRLSHKVNADLIVDLDNPDIASVRVKVALSGVRLQQAMLHTREALGYTIDRFEQWRKHERVIYLNVNKPSEAVQQTFQNGVDSISAYHRSNEKIRF